MLKLMPNCSAATGTCPDTLSDISSFECTFCASCETTVLGGICPNCGGNLVRARSGPVLLQTYRPPASASRRNPHGPR